MLADARAAQDAAAKAAAEAERAMQLANEKAMCEMKRLGLTEDGETSGGFAQLQPSDTGLTTPVGGGAAPRSATPIGPPLSGEHRFSRPDDLETWHYDLFHLENARHQGDLGFSKYLRAP